MTRDEVLYSSRKYLEAAEQARGYRTSEQKRAEDLRVQRHESQEKLETCGAEKVNLEKRLTDVQRIIRTMDTTVEMAIAGANRSAGKAGERFAAVIRCSGTVNASIGTVYLTKTVGDDANSATAYQLCRNEEARLIDGIEALRERMSDLKNIIASLGKSISLADNNVLYYSNQIRKCEEEASYLAMVASKM